MFFPIEPNFSRRLKESASEGGLLFLQADGRGLLLVARAVPIRARPLRAEKAKKKVDAREGASTFSTFLAEGERRKK